MSFYSILMIDLMHTVDNHTDRWNPMVGFSCRTQQPHSLRQVMAKVGNELYFRVVFENEPIRGVFRRVKNETSGK